MTTEQKVPDLLVEQLVAGELGVAQRVATEARLRDEGGDRVTALRQSNEEILERYPAAQMTAEIRRRAAIGQSAESVAKWRPLFWIPAAAAVAAVAVIAVIAVNRGFWRPESTVNPEDQPTQPWVAFKGTEPGVKIYMKDGDREKALLPEQIVRRGDVLQLACDTGTARHAVIFSVDGAGAVTLHFPEKPEDTTEVKPGRQFKLPFGYELDDAPGFERFFMVWTEVRSPLNVAEILSTAKKMKDARREKPELPAGAKVNDFLLLKSDAEGVAP